MDKPHWLLLELFELDLIRKIDLYYKLVPISNEYKSCLRVTDYKGEKVEGELFMMLKLLKFEPNLGAVAELKYECRKRVLDWKQFCEDNNEPNSNEKEFEGAIYGEKVFLDACELCADEFTWQRDPRDTFGIIDKTAPIGRPLRLCPDCYESIETHLVSRYRAAVPSLPKWIV